MRIFAPDLDASCLSDAKSICKRSLLKFARFQQTSRHDTDAFAYLVCFRRKALAYCIAWDKVQSFRLVRPGKASRVETGNIDSMLFYCSITAKPGISEATNIRCEDEKIHRIDADNGHLR